MSPTGKIRIIAAHYFEQSQIEGIWMVLGEDAGGVRWSGKVEHIALPGFPEDSSSIQWSIIAEV